MEILAVMEGENGCLPPKSSRMFARPLPECLAFSLVVGQDVEGFGASAVITDEAGEHSQATGALGSFPTEMEARQFAIEYAKAKIARCALMKLMG